MPELSLWLDNYDDIYSDFDSRHYLKRRISEDFLHELRLSKKYKKETVTDILLLLPQEKRSEENEKIIANSLREFFKDQFRNNNDKYRKKMRTGIVLFIIGFAIMTINSYLAYKGLHSFAFSVARVILEPAGWFLLWLAFDFLIYDLRTIRKETEFFNELSQANVHFKSS